MYISIETIGRSFYAEMAHTTKEDARNLSVTIPVIHRELEDRLGDTLHDTLFNYIPSACLETALSIEVLQNPGEAGEKIDQAAEKMAQSLEEMYWSGRSALVKGQKGQLVAVPLRELIYQKILHELRPNGTQIGRCLSYEGSNWEEDGIKWLLGVLTTPGTPGEKNALLTKIRAISAFGNLLYGTIDANKALYAELLGVPEEALSQKYEACKRNLRHDAFGSKEARLRTERAPIINGTAIDDLEPKPERVWGPLYGESTGYLYREHSFTPGQEAICDELLRQKTVLSNEGIERKQQVINDFSRPGILTDDAVRKMPKSFRDAGLPQLLDDHQIYHGNGINRWIQQGSYAIDTLDQDLPIAGSCSGSTADILFGIDCLRGTSSIYGTREAEGMGILIAAWMNYGGYHSFVETFPIAQAVAANQVFNVSVKSNRKQFYREFMSAIEEHAVRTDGVDAFYKAYRKINRALKLNKKSIVIPGVHSPMSGA